MVVTDVVIIIILITISFSPLRMWPENKANHKYIFYLSDRAIDVDRYRGRTFAFITLSHSLRIPVR